MDRGKRYHVMAKLDPVKIAWIIRQKQNGMHNQKIAHAMDVSARWIQKLCSRFNSTGAIPSKSKWDITKERLQRKRRQLYHRPLRDTGAVQYSLKRQSG
jgi:transposase